MDAAFGVTTADVAILEFDFTLTDVTRDDLALNFVFASEEYNESVGSLSDVLAIFVDGVDITDNIAMSTCWELTSRSRAKQSIVAIRLIPRVPAVSTRTLSQQRSERRRAVSLPVRLRRLHSDADGRIANLNPNVSHHIIIAIADVGDASGDSAIFLQADSLIAYDASDPTQSDRFIRDPAGIDSIRHSGVGDQNVLRDQGQVLIHSNAISDSADFGIVTTSGDRDSVENAFVEGNAREASAVASADPDGCAI